MAEIYNYIFRITTIFEKCVERLSRRNQFFIPCDILRKAIDKEITDFIKKYMNNVISETCKKELNNLVSYFTQEGFSFMSQVEIRKYPTSFIEDIDVKISDFQWERIIEIATEYGFKVCMWDDMEVLVMPTLESAETRDFLDFSFKCRKSIDEIIMKEGSISFYGGELYTREQEEGSEFFHNKFMISSYQTNLDPEVDRTEFYLDQLTFWADTHNKQVKREIAADAIVTVEILEIC
ncbi:MAG: hypothetical protein IKG14_03370 [Clostridia bacterium]|nr:hypothetical protein [Clostridia bacterium]